jgi:hypothetical protein
MEMTTYILTSWNNTAPEEVNSTWAVALEMAKARAAKEGSCVHVLDYDTSQVRDVAADGHVGKWFFSDIVFDTEVNQ